MHTHDNNYAHIQQVTVQPGERLPLTITVRDQVNNSREAIWSLDGPHGNSVWHSLLGLTDKSKINCNENLLQFLDGISTTNEVYFYSVPDLKSLVLGGEVGEKCSSEVVQRKIGDTNFVGNFNLTFTLPGTLVCLSIIVLRCVTTLIYGEYQRNCNWQNSFLNDHI